MRRFLTHRACETLAALAVLGLATIAAPGCASPSADAESSAAAVSAGGGTCHFTTDGTVTGCDDSAFCAANPEPATPDDRRNEGRCEPRSKLIDGLAAQVKKSIPGTASPISGKLETVVEVVPAGTSCGRTHADSSFDAQGSTCSVALPARASGRVNQMGVTTAPGISFERFSFHRTSLDMGPYPGIPDIPLVLELRSLLTTLGDGYVAKPTPLGSVPNVGYCADVFHKLCYSNGAWESDSSDIYDFSYVSARTRDAWLAKFGVPFSASFLAPENLFLLRHRDDPTAQVREGDEGGPELRAAFPGVKVRVAPQHGLVVTTKGMAAGKIIAFAYANGYRYVAGGPPASWGVGSMNVSGPCNEFHADGVCAN